MPTQFVVLVSRGQTALVMVRLTDGIFESIDILLSYYLCLKKDVKYSLNMGKGYTG